MTDANQPTLMPIHTMASAKSVEAFKKWAREKELEELAKPWTPPPKPDGQQLESMMLDEVRAVRAIIPRCPRCQGAAYLWRFPKDGKTFFQVRCHGNHPFPNKPAVCDYTAVPNEPIPSSEAAVRAWKLAVTLSTL